MVTQPKHWLVYGYPLTNNEIKDKKQSHLFNDHFLLIQVPKNGSTSLLHHFDSLVQKLTIDEIPIYRHGTAGEWLQHYGSERFNKMHTVAVVRNPFTRSVSLYQHRLRNKEIPEHTSFDEWLSSNDGELFQHRYLCNRQGDLLISRYFKLEKGMSHVTKYITNLGIPSLPLKSVYQNTNPDNINQSYFTNFFSDSTYHKALQILSEDFKIFNYSTNLDDCLS